MATGVVREGTMEPLLPMRPGVSFIPRRSDSSASATVVQFEVAIFYGEESEGKVVAGIQRFGDLSKSSSVRYHTEDGSAKAGQTFVACAGEASFEPEEDLKLIEIPLLPSSMWAATLEFKLRLESPSNCVLGAYLHFARVKVIDADYFPHAKFRGLEEAAVNGFSLLRSYMAWNFDAAGVKATTLATFMLDQLKNVYALVVIYTEAYLVNVVCNPDSSQDRLLLPTRLETAYLVCAILIIPYCFLHVCHQLRSKMDVVGCSQVFLQQNLFRKYFNLSEDAKVDVKPELFENAVINEAAAVAGGYSAALAGLEILGRIGVNMYFVLAKSPGSSLVAVGVPIFVVVWTWLRAEVCKPPSPKRENMSLQRSLREAVLSYDTIAAYFFRPKTNEQFAERSESVRAKVVQKAMHLSTTEFVVDVLGPLFSCAFIATHIRQVLSGDMELGTFLATMKAIQAICKECSSGSKTLRTLVASFSPLRSVTKVLNASTDLHVWMQVNNRRRALSCAKPGTHPDVLPIRLEAVSYSVGGGPGSRVLFRGIDLEVPQGRIINISGQHNAGKATLLRLVAHQIFPCSGSIFVPAHLRILFVQQEPQFLDRSLLDNLTIGLSARTEADTQRAREILRLLGLQSALDMLDQEAQGKLNQDPDKWVKGLTSSAICLFCLARAFVMNPEVMVLQKPFLPFQKDTALLVAKLLKEHVENRGLKLDPATVADRRPRTVFFSSDAEHTQFEDVVWSLEMVGDEKGHNSTTVVRASSITP